MLIYMVSKPLNLLRRVLLIAMAACILIGMIFFGEFFSLSRLSLNLVLLQIFMIVYAYLIYTAFHKIGEIIGKKKKTNTKNTNRIIN